MVDLGMGDTKATVNPGADNRKWRLIQVWVKRKHSPGLGNTAATANADTGDMEIAVGRGMGDTKDSPGTGNYGSDSQSRWR